MPPGTTNSWLLAGLLAGAMFSLGTVYLLLSGDTATAYSLNRLIADVAVLLIGYSMAVVAVKHFFGVGSAFTTARKELGVLGFYLVIVHGVLTFALPRFSIHSLTSKENIVGFTAAVISFALLFGMTIISVKAIKDWFGVPLWRRLLQLGIWAYIIGMLHAAIKIFPHLVAWWQSDRFFMPLSGVVLSATIFLLGTKYLFDWTKPPSPPPAAKPIRQ